MQETQMKGVCICFTHHLFIHSLFIDFQKTVKKNKGLLIVLIDFFCVIHNVCLCSASQLPGCMMGQIISLLHKFCTIEWSIDLYHFYHYCHLLIVHVESKNYQTLAHSACLRELGTRRFIMIGKSFKRQNSAPKKLIFFVVKPIL